MANKSAGQAQEEDEQNERLSNLEQQQAPAAAEQAPAAAEPSMTDQLNQLSTLHQQGALTDAEFTSAKAKLLGS